MKHKLLPNGEKTVSYQKPKYGVFLSAQTSSDEYKLQIECEFVQPRDAIKYAESKFSKDCFHVEVIEGEYTRDGVLYNLENSVFKKSLY